MEPACPIKSCTPANTCEISQPRKTPETSDDLVNNIKRDGIVGHAKETLSTSLTYSALPLTWGSLQSAKLTSWAGVIFHSLLKFSSSVDPGASWVLCFRRDPLNELDLNLKLLFRSRPLLSSSSGVPWLATLEDMLIEAVSVYGLSVKVHLPTYYLAGKGAKQSGNVLLRTHNLQILCIHQMHVPHDSRTLALARRAPLIVQHIHRISAKPLVFGHRNLHPPQ